MTKIKLVLSFDYELPLGASRNYKRGLFEPTANLLELADKLKVPICLFADICSALKFKEWDENEYYIPFVNQLQNALKRKHEVQLHIHPHWMNSTFQNGEFIPSSNYMLSTFKDFIEPLNIPGIIYKASDSLNEICDNAIPGYKCIAYRAGGFNLEPNSEIIFKSLAEKGIKIDSSIIKNYYWHTEFVTINYRGMPKQGNWFINDGQIRHPSNNGIFEVPIAAKPKTFITNFPDKMRRKIHKERAYNHEGKGYGVKLGGLTLKDKFFQSISPRMLTFDVHSHRVKDLISIIDYNFKKYKDEKTIYLSLLSHPKAMGQYHFSLMKGFVEGLREKYKNSIEFTTYNRVVSELNL